MIVRSSIFFFQAEDGIRFVRVTGVKTCAVPISLLFLIGFSLMFFFLGLFRVGGGRLEERWVGKECRSRLLPYQ